MADLSETYLRTTRSLADPGCRECSGSGICGWGLNGEGEVPHALPCIRCRLAEYEAGADAVVKMERKQNAAAAWT